jgi:hypothetical protein
MAPGRLNTLSAESLNFGSGLRPGNLIKSGLMPFHQLYLNKKETSYEVFGKGVTGIIPFPVLGNILLQRELP